MKFRALERKKERSLAKHVEAVAASVIASFERIIKEEAGE